MVAPNVTALHDVPNTIIVSNFIKMNIFSIVLVAKIKGVYSKKVTSKRHPFNDNCANLFKNFNIPGINLKMEEFVSIHVYKTSCFIFQLH